MTSDKVYKLIEDNGLTLHGDIEHFAALVADAEREACAKVCEDNANDLSEGDWDSACINCADHIRARSST